MKTIGSKLSRIIVGGLLASTVGFLPLTAANAVESDTTSTITAGDVEAILKDSGFTKNAHESGNDVFSKRIDNHNVVYSIPSNPNTKLDKNTLEPVTDGVNTYKVNLGWDNGPRIYMTGADFVAITPDTLKELCGNLPVGVNACSDLVNGIYDSLKNGALKEPANDNTCYDLSQAINSSWGVQPDEKCA